MYFMNPINAFFKETQTYCRHLDQNGTRPCNCLRVFPLWLRGGPDRPAWPGHGLIGETENFLQNVRQAALLTDGETP